MSFTVNAAGVPTLTEKELDTDSDKHNNGKKAVDLDVEVRPPTPLGTVAIDARN